MTISEAKIMTLLWALQIEGTLGRYRLQGIVGLGEGVVRGILAKLSRSGYVKTQKNVGCKITSLGSSRLAALMSRYGVARVKLVDAGLLGVGPFSVAVHVRDKAHLMVDGVNQRDAAVRAGASGAITLFYRDGFLLIPPDQVTLSEKNRPLSQTILENFKPSNYDKVIIASGDSQWKAFEGAVAAAASLLQRIMFGSDRGLGKRSPIQV